MTHAANLRRVSDNIGDVVYGFCAGRVGRQFHARDLRNYVAYVIPGLAPDSPGRILRRLRLAGRVDYEVVSRRASLYRVVAVRP